MMMSNVTPSQTSRILQNFGRSLSTVARRHLTLPLGLWLHHFGVDTMGGLLSPARQLLLPFLQQALVRNCLLLRLVPLANHTGHSISCQDIIEGSSRLGTASVKHHCSAPCLGSSSPILPRRHSWPNSCMPDLMECFYAWPCWLRRTRSGLLFAVDFCRFPSPPLNGGELTCRHVGHCNWVGRLHPPRSCAADANARSLVPAPGILA